MNEQLDILVIEDDDFDFRVLSRHLAGMSYSLRRCVSIQEAEAVLADSRVDLAIVDYLIGEDSGLDFLQSVRGRQADFPVIILTGADTKSTGDMAAEHGAADFLSKAGLSRELLARTIRFAIDNHKSILRERSLRKDAERSANKYQQLLSYIGHEIGTPLEAMVRHLDRMVGEVDEGPVVEDLRSTKNAAMHIIEFVRNMTEYVKLEKGSSQPSRHPVELSRLFSQVEDLLRPHIDHKEIEFCIDTEHLHGLTVHADPLYLRQVLINLIKNAVQFTDEGTITVSAEDCRDNIRLVVTDTGRGIPQEKIALISQGEPVESENGLGIGLAISRRFVSLMGGSLEIKSEPATGTVAQITLPAGVKPASVNAA